MPAIIISGAPGIIVPLQNASGYTGQYGPNLETLPALVKDMKLQANVSRFLLVPYGWENRGTWAGINYFPPQPSTRAWHDVNQALAATGDATMMLVSGYWCENILLPPPNDTKDQMKMGDVIFKTYIWHIERHRTYVHLLKITSPKYQTPAPKNIVSLVQFNAEGSVPTFRKCFTCSLCFVVTLVIHIY